MKSQEYYQSKGENLKQFIPENCKRIIELGCGEGLLSKELKEKGKYVVGIEIVPDVAKKAEKNLNKVISGDIEKISPDLEKNSYDCLICGDVLEHLHDPLAVLKKMEKFLTKDAVIIASIPNIQHYTVVVNLLMGNWKYKKAGLLDETHLKFFTFKSIKEMFQEAGFEIKKVGFTTPITINNKFPDHEKRLEYWKNEQLDKKLKEIVSILTDKDENFKNIEMNLPSFAAYQYLIVAQRIN